MTERECPDHGQLCWGAHCARRESVPARPRLNPARALERIKGDQTLLQSPERMLELLRELDRDAYEAGLEHGRNEVNHEGSEPAHLDRSCNDCGANYGAGGHVCANNEDIYGAGKDITGCDV